MTERPKGTDPPAYRLTLTGDGIQIDKKVDSTSAAEIVALAMGPVGSGSQSPQVAKSRQRGAARGTKKSSRERGKEARRRGGPRVLKELSLRPPGGTPFVEFAREKQPKTHPQKHAVIVLWLRDETGLNSGITVDHVNTCYVEAGWSRPNDLSNTLVVTAARKGWLDTSDMSNIEITPRGEDEVSHNLPPQGKRGRP